MEAQRERLIAMVEKAALQLAEHCDSVRIFITAKDETNNENWITYSEGRGNIYAQEGQVLEWIERQRERMRIDTRKNEKGEE